MQTKFTANRSMTKAEFIAHCRAEQAKREQNAADHQEEYCLTLIGANPNDINSYAVCSMEGKVYLPKAGKTYLIGFVGKNGFRPNPDAGAMCPDQYRIDAMNERLVAMGEAAFIRTKHARLRHLLFIELPEVI